MARLTGGWHKQHLGHSIAKKKGRWAGAKKHQVKTKYTGTHFDTDRRELLLGGVADHKPDASFNKNSLLEGMKVERETCKLKSVKSDKYYNKNQLSIGKKIEMEHTKNKNVAKIIAKNHLDEFPKKKYYSELIKLEKKLKK